ncbi:Biogenesis of lysosome-related organelles complex 1 subunit 2 [Halotydeus destructor]|nr:Biogenesis of lysosome-related organelles complex 1 subunit 2 [Halotydeus destructor]
MSADNNTECPAVNQIAEPDPNELVNPVIASLTDELFTKTASYVQAELDNTLDDYKLLEEMNKVTSSKYSTMSNLCESLSSSVNQLEASYELLTPFLDKIDLLDEKVTKLEELAYAVDSYSKRLENRFKSLDKQSTKS